MVKPKGKKILIIDDSELVRYHLRSTLSQEGFGCVHESKDAATAEEKMVRNRYDIILCDWHLPGMTGLEFLQRVRASESGKTIPFLMLTGETDRECVMDAIKSGVTDYIIKPYSHDSVLKKIMRALEQAEKG